MTGECAIWYDWVGTMDVQCETDGARTEGENREKRTATERSRTVTAREDSREDCGGGCALTTTRATPDQQHHHHEETHKEKYYTYPVKQRQATRVRAVSSEQAEFLFWKETRRAREGTSQGINGR